MAVTIRPIDYKRDATALKSYLDAGDSMRLDQCEAAVRDGDAFILVADEEGTACGLVVVHLAYRTDQGWQEDGDTINFQRGDNAYLEEIAVAERLRNRGIGGELMEAAETEAKRRRKRVLWLHTNVRNAGAHRFYERIGWQHETTVTPVWHPDSPTRVYKKVL